MMQVAVDINYLIDHNKEQNKKQTTTLASHAEPVVIEVAAEHKLRAQSKLAQAQIFRTKII